MQDKDEEIKQLRDLIIEMKDSINRVQIDSDKVSVAALTKVIKRINSWYLYSLKML